MRMPAGCPYAPANQPALSACSAVDVLLYQYAWLSAVLGSQRALGVPSLSAMRGCQRAHAMDVSSSGPAWLPEHAYDEHQDAWLPEMKCDKSCHMRLVRGAALLECGSA